MTAEQSASGELTAGSDTIAITRSQERFASWMADVLVYTVVLNLFVEYFDAIIIDSFTISILTAVLLKALLDTVVGLEHRVSSYFRQREGTIFKILGLVSVFSILFLSKFFILEVVDLVFGDHVELGHFLEIVGLIIAMMLARAIMDRIYRSLGNTDAAV